MIEEQYGKYIIVCNSCGIDHDEKYETFEDAVAELAPLGYSALFILGEWVNHCPVCMREELESKGLFTVI